MRKLLCLSLLLISAHAKAEIFEIVVSKFKPGLKQSKEMELAKSLNSFLKEQSGFNLREVYYDEAQKSYIDIVVWSDEKSAKDAVTKAEKSPICQPVFSQIEQSGMIFLHAKKLLSFKK